MNLKHYNYQYYNQYYYFFAQYIIETVIGKKRFKTNVAILLFFT